MLETIFLRYLNISVTTGLVIGVLLLMAPVFRRRYTAKWKYWLWLLLAVRLILPITIGEEKAAIVVNVPYENLVVIPETGSEQGELEQADMLNELTGEYATNDMNGTIVAEKHNGFGIVDFMADAENGKDRMELPGNASLNGEGMLGGKVVGVPVLANLLPQITFWDIACAVWLLGILVFAMYHLIGHMVFRRGILRRAQNPTDGKITVLVEEISGEIGLNKKIQIKICPAIASPMMMGLVHPLLVLPKEEYSEEEMHFILLHELHHCKRNDLWYKLLLLTANALHWYNPFVWMMCKEANGDLERTCDDEVLCGASFEERKAYTQTILDGIRAQLAHENNLSTYFYGGKKDLKNRFTNILDRSNRRSGKTVLLAVLVCVLAVGSLVACVYREDAVNEGADSGTNSEHILAEDADEGAINVPKEEGEDKSTESDSNLEEADDDADHEANDEVWEGHEIEEVPDVITEEDIGEVLETENATYQATRYGIYRVTEEGSERIYPFQLGQTGFAGYHPQMQVFEDRLYLLTDTMHNQYSLDWADNAIRWIDLETLNTGLLDLGLASGSTISDFRVYDGFIHVNQGGNNVGGRSYLLPVEGKVVYNGKAAEELTEQERQEYGVATSRWLVENPGKLINVSNRTATENYALLDMNMDGTAEEIGLQIYFNEYPWYELTGEYEILLNGQSVVQAYADNQSNTIWAISLDGKEVMIVLYEDGPSWDPCTSLYRYEEGKLVKAGALGTDIRECEITEDGVIHGRMRNDVIETSWCYVSWQMNEQHMLEVVPQESYEFVQYERELKLLEELTLYTEPNGSESFKLSPQEVSFLQVSSDEHWIMLEAADGSIGWFEIEDYFTIAESGKEPREIFEGLNFAD